MEIQLTVGEAYKTDIDRSICRIDSATMRKLGIEAGDIVMIKGKNKTPAVAWRSRPEDDGLGIIRIDGTTRFNAGAGLGEIVSVEKTTFSDAESLTLSPIEKLSISGNISKFFKEQMMSKPFIKGNKVAFDVMGNTFYFVVTATNPSGVVMVTPSTRINISSRPVKPEIMRIPDVSYDNIGGLDHAIEKIREMVELPLKHPAIFTRLGIDAPKGVLLHGPPGCGKTLLARAVANETSANFYTINGPELMSKYYGQSEENLRKVFEEADRNAPSIIFIDEIDSIAPKREDVGGDLERRLVSQMLTLMDGLKSRGRVIVIAATNRPNAIDPALRRPGRFDREIVIGMPSAKERKEILIIHTRGMPLAKDVDLDWLAGVTHGYTGADLETLCKEAAMKTLRRALPDIKKIDESMEYDVIKKLVVTKKDFMDALREVEPSGMREVMIETPNVKWKDIGGLDDAKRMLRESIELPQKHPESFARMGISPPRGFMLYGPPGCGKTLLAKAIATESGCNFIAIKGPEVFSKWVGESERAIRDIFKRAKEVAPSIIFFDEIDAIAPRRGMSGDTHVSERTVSQLLTEIDGIEKLKDVIIIGATNRLDMIDPALLRPGRFEKQIYVAMPDRKARKKIFEVHTRSMPLAKDVELEWLARSTEGFSGADIEALCREAGMEAIRENVKANEVRKSHFQRALETIRPSTGRHGKTT